MAAESDFTDLEMRLAVAAHDLQDGLEKLFPEGLKIVFVVAAENEFSIGRARVGHDEAHHLLRQAIESMGEDLPTNPLRLVVDNTTGASKTSNGTAGDDQ
jgi:hypothetical protein